MHFLKVDGSMDGFMFKPIFKELLNTVQKCCCVKWIL